MPSALVPLLETNAGTGAVPVPLKSASASVMFSIVTLPVLVTVNVYSMVFPSADSTPVLAKDSDGSAGTLTTVGTPGSPGVPGLSTSGVDGTGVIGAAGLPGSVVGGVPVVVAAFSTSPASFSACVMV